MVEAELEQQLVRYFQARAGHFELHAHALTAERVFNWGGFGTPSFRVGDGVRRLHVKLAADATELRRWLAVHERLEQAYGAPRILAWIDVPETSYGGLVFEHIDGATWDPATQPELLHGLRDLLGRLHRDGELADSLGAAPRSYEVCWELRYREQYEQDLAAVRMNRPASVSEERRQWMEEESRKVLALAAGHVAFAGTTRAPCHGDLWPGNVLVERGGAWWTLDWDGLGVGDEAEDYATLVWPFVHGQDRDWRELLGGEWDGPFAARLKLHLRAISLDYVIDALADWAEWPLEWQASVRPKKEAEHHAYWAWYRDRWG